jgi:hypothetical protein
MSWDQNFNKYENRNKKILILQQGKYFCEFDKIRGQKCN